MLTSLVEFIVIAIPVLHCYIFLPLLRVLTKNGRYRTTVAALSAPANSVWPLRHSSVIYSILLDRAASRRALKVMSASLYLKRCRTGSQCSKQHSLVALGDHGELHTAMAKVI